MTGRANDIIAKLEENGKMNFMNSSNINFLHKYEKIKNIIDKINVESRQQGSINNIIRIKNIINKEENANKDYLKIFLIFSPIKNILNLTFKNFFKKKKESVYKILIKKTKNRVLK